MSAKELNFDIDDASLEDEIVADLPEKGPSKEQLKRIELAFKDILSDEPTLVIDADDEDAGDLMRIWKYIERSRKEKNDEKDIVKISSREYADVRKEDERVKDLSCDFDENAGLYLSRLNENDDLFG